MCVMAGDPAAILDHEMSMRTELKPCANLELESLKSLRIYYISSHMPPAGFMWKKNEDIYYLAY